MPQDLITIRELIARQQQRLAAGPDMYARHAIHALQNAATAIEMQTTYDAIQAQKATAALTSAEKARARGDEAEASALERAVPHG